MLKFKTTVFRTAFQVTLAFLSKANLIFFAISLQKPYSLQSGSDGVRLLAVKFVETLVLLYTPDPYISSVPPQEPDFGNFFFQTQKRTISWLPAFLHVTGCLFLLLLCYYRCSIQYFMAEGWPCSA